MFSTKRRRYFIDKKVQGALLLRAAVYWVCCLFVVTVVLFVWQTVTGRARVLTLQLDALWFRYGPAFVITACLLPLVLVDIVRLSNRFAGPAYRLRRALRQLAKGEKVAPISFRQGDFWQEFAEDFNRIADQMDKLETPKREEEEPVAVR